MNKEDQSLLFKDLCARLPYGVIVKYKSREGEGDVQLGCGNIGYVSQLGNGWWKECKPYLRPMSSMTEEEEKEFNKVVYDSIDIDNISPCVCVANWLYSKCFDVYGLIPKGLAIEATEENNPYKY